MIDDKIKIANQVTAVTKNWYETLQKQLPEPWSQGACISTFILSWLETLPISMRNRARVELIHNLIENKMSEMESKIVLGL